MANPFASSTQSSLFPLTFPSVRISKDEYHLFYSYERSLFRTLVAFLNFGVNEAALVIGFLCWLERGGYTSYPLIGKFFHSSLSVEAINEVADEVLICIKFLQRKASNLIPEGSSEIRNISKLQRFLDQKRIHLDELYDYGDLIYGEVCCIATDLSEKAFGMLNLVAPPDQRTIFVTFSKGYPLTANDVREFFTGMFGDIIESIHMPRPGGTDRHPIYALMVVRNPYWVTKVIQGGHQHRKSDYVINDKHVRVRRYVPKETMKDRYFKT